MQTINEFLVSIGYDVRDQSEFDVALKKVEGFVLKLGVALLAAEAAIQAVVVKTTIALDQANFSAMRTGSSVAGLQSLAYALEQTGRSSGKAEDLLGGFAQALRRFPGAEVALQRLGVQTREHGRLRETSALFRDAVKSMNAIPSYVVANNYAGLLGISEDDYAHLRANSDRIAQFEQEQAELTAKFGLDRNAAGAASTALAGAWRASLLTMEALLLKLTMTIGPILSPVIMHVREWIEANRDRIIAVCRALVEVALGLSRQLADLVRALAPVADSFLALAEAITGSQGFLVAVELVAGVWLAGIAARFLAPIALVIAALAGLSALNGATPAKAAEAGGKPGREKRGGIFARARAAVTRRRTHGATGSWGEGGASGSWGDGEGQTFDRGGGNPGTDPIQTNLTTYSPRQGGDSMEGGYPSSVRGPDGQAIVRTLEAYRKGEAGYVTVAGNSAFYGRKYTADSITYRVGDETFTLKNVPMVVHDTGGAFKGAPEGRFDVPVGRDLNSRDTNQGLRGVTFRPGWAPKPAENAPLPPEKPPELRRMDQESMFMAPALGTTGDDLSLSARQETEIVVHGDPDPTKTSTEVSAAQRRVNKGLTDQTEKAMA